MSETAGPVGVVLAGGGGRRIGGGKAVVALHGVPLIAYPVAALQAALDEVVIVAKRETELPLLPGVGVWTEPDLPRHPLVGIVHALACAQGAAVLVCAGDLPFVTAPFVRRLCEVDAAGAPAIVPRAGGRLQPLLALYRPQAHAPLAAALAGAERAAPLRDVVAGLDPHVLEVADQRQFFNVNRPEDLLTASAMLDREGA